MNGFYRLPQIKVPLDYKAQHIKQQIEKLYHIKGDYTFDIVKKSVDARKKDRLFFVFTVDVYTNQQPNNKKLQSFKYYNHQPTYEGPKLLKPYNDLRPIVIGSGPAGLFCALILAEAGLKPLVLERGKDVDQRMMDIQKFFDEGVLNPNSNIQFGEGGAGTFSDGKINTGVKDKANRIDKIVHTFIDCGAPDDIKIASKPHIGTDYLITVVKNMREQIISLGGEVRFDACVTDIEVQNNQIKSVTVNNTTTIETHSIVLAIGHSARDTFYMLEKVGVKMEPKAFAIGLRIEHPQEWINKSQYDDFYNHKALPVADYKLTYRTKKGRAVYTFCMCPGGFVVNAASEEGGVVCNGMSNFNRDEVNANSAVLVNVHPEDFGSAHLLAGVAFQRRLEQKAYQLSGSNYSLPLQRLEDFYKAKATVALGKVTPNVKGQYKFVDLNNCLPDFVCEAIKEGLQDFGRKIKGFDDPDALLIGVETRSSSPIRMDRNELFESPIQGLYPCGEGAGYAGGIMSAALDGIKVAESIIAKINDVPKQ